MGNTLFRALVETELLATLQEKVALSDLIGVELLRGLDYKINIPLLIRSEEIDKPWNCLLISHCLLKVSRLWKSL